ncbi:MAG: helix-turn-helix domain-containing protein [Candidatus Limnocylindria bacterium]
MSSISVPEAAQRLGVSEGRVRQRIADGSLLAERVGGRWVIAESSLPAARDRLHARPLSVRMSAAVLALLDRQVPDVSPQEKSRARKYAKRLMEADAEAAALMRAWFKERASRRYFRAAEADLAALGQDHRLALSGVSAAQSGIVAQGLVEGYVAAADLESLVEDYFLVPGQVGDGNVIIHVPNGSEQSLVLDRVRDSKALLAADLAEHNGSREDARVRELINSLADVR